MQCKIYVFEIDLELQQVVFIAGFTASLTLQPGLPAQWTACYISVSIPNGRSAKTNFNVFHDLYHGTLDSRACIYFHTCQQWCKIALLQ